MRVMRRVFRKTMPKRSSSKSKGTSKPSTTIRVSAPVAGPVGSAKDTVIGGLVVTGMLGFLVLGVSAALGGHHDEPAASVAAPVEQTNDYVAPIQPLICGVNLDCTEMDHALADKAAWAPAPKKAAKAAKSTSTTSTSSGSTASTTKTTSVRTSTSKSGTTSVTRTTSVRTTK